LTGGSMLICPLHAWKFDLATGAAFDKDCALRTYPARVDQRGHVVVTVEADGS
jgi:nitrite reductase (NADH) small subunit